MKRKSIEETISTVVLSFNEDALCVAYLIHGELNEEQSRILFDAQGVGPDGGLKYYSVYSILGVSSVTENCEVKLSVEDAEILNENELPQSRITRTTNLKDIPKHKIHTIVCFEYS